MLKCGAISTLLFACAVSGCTVPLASWSSHVTAPPDDGSALDARLTRCAALGANASDDPSCQSAWAEARHRILPVPAEK